MKFAGQLLMFLAENVLFVKYAMLSPEHQTCWRHFSSDLVSSAILGNAPELTIQTHQCI